MASKPQSPGRLSMDKYESMANEALYEELKINDRGAWTYMYNKFLRVCRWKEWRLADEEVEDIAAEACAALIKRIHREDIEEIRDIKGYSLWVLRNEITNHYRRSHPQTTVVSIDDQATIADDRNIIDLVYMIDIASRVRNVVDKLPAKCKGLIDAYLKYLDGIYGTYEEMAVALERNSKTIYGNIVTCLKKLATFGELKSLSESI
jgi:RNA polymerase sigma factor (sigma-70 family)